jgi:acetyltransferase-like isoleucine patch superfamily enzyme
MIEIIKTFIKKQSNLVKLASILKIGTARYHIYSKKIKGEKNVLSFDQLATIESCYVDIQGDSNIIEVNTYAQLHNVTFYIRGNHSQVKIDKYVKFKRGGSIWIEDDFCQINIGEKSTFENVHLAVTENESKITIGKDCMFAYDIDVRTGDSHSIIDQKTNKRINRAKDIEIGDHVWVASHVSILKGVVMSSSTVVATRSVVTKSFKEGHVLLGGIPATVIKNNINWDRRRNIE